ncbi:hypothetical protein V1511DRAFT_494752 [Dipodascopsis uninucleata]
MAGIEDESFDDFGYGSSDDSAIIEVATAADSQYTRPPSLALQRSDPISVNTLSEAIADSDINMTRFQTPKRQLDLFGRVAVNLAKGGVERSPLVYRRPQDFVPLWSPQPTRQHHSLVTENLDSFVYPSNLPIREYQKNITNRALLSNLLCSLPTGLGKTLIAAVVMLNFYRWTTKSKIIFMAPTRPLVTQQAEACFNIVGIPRNDTAVLVGSTSSPAIRDLIWQERRVFFVTPQTLNNDIDRGAIDPRDIVCLVVDEAHRATGNYAYAEIVRKLYAVSDQCRILALSATPGSSVEAVQEVISNLKVSHAEIRTEDSADVKDYVRGTSIDVQIVPLSQDIEQILDGFVRVMAPMVDDLNRMGVIYTSDPRKLAHYTLVKAQDDLKRNPNSKSVAWKAYPLFKALSPITYAASLLKTHGINQCIDYLKDKQVETQLSRLKDPVKYELETFSKTFMLAKQISKRPDFVSHEKITALINTLEGFFSRSVDGSKSSKVIIFCEYRSSAAEVSRVLETISDVKSHLFIGQAAGRDSSAGMSQKLQQEVLQSFHKGKYNTLIATCIGEEGLDIKQVDLIVCYDAPASPVRVLQRIGRTGRFRDGRVVTLLTEAEKRKWDKAMSKYKEIQHAILDSSFEFIPCARIIPDNVTPKFTPQAIEIPKENESAEPVDAPPVPRTRVTKTKRKPKAFSLPEDAETSFLSASELLRQNEALTPGITKAKRKRSEQLVQELDQKENSNPVATKKPRKSSSRHSMGLLANQLDVISTSRARKSASSSSSSLHSLAYSPHQDNGLLTTGLLTRRQEDELREKYRTVSDGNNGKLIVKRREYDPVESIRATKFKSSDARIPHSFVTNQLIENMKNIDMTAEQQCYSIGNSAEVRQVSPPAEIVVNDETSLQSGRNTSGIRNSMGLTPSSPLTNSSDLSENEVMDIAAILDKYRSSR